MRILKRLQLVLLLASNAMVFAQTDKFQWKETVSGVYAYNYVTNDPLKTRFYILKNGLTVILSPTSKDPRIQCYVATKAGSKTDPATHTGLAHYLEHLLFKGTDKYGSLDWTKEKPELDKIEALYEEYKKTTDPVKRTAIYKLIDSVTLCFSFGEKINCRGYGKIRRGEKAECRGDFRVLIYLQNL